FYVLPTRSHHYFAGQIHGTRWQLRVRDSGDGRYCFKVFTNGDLRGSKCGRFYGPGVAGELGWISRCQGARPSFVAGAGGAGGQGGYVRVSGRTPRIVPTSQPTRVP